VVAQEAEARRYRGLIKYWPAVCAGVTQNRREFVGIFLKAVGVALVVVLVVRLDGQARELRGPTGSLGPERKMLGCYVNDHMLYVGSSFFVPKGTLITFVAKLENAGLYRQRLYLPSDIHILFINVSVYYPLLPVFQDGNCEAWFIRRPVVAPGR
jgi:hypothetical protein